MDGRHRPVGAEQCGAVMAKTSTTPLRLDTSNLWGYVIFRACKCRYLCPPAFTLDVGRFKGGLLQRDPSFFLPATV